MEDQGVNPQFQPTQAPQPIAPAPQSKKRLIVIVVAAIVLIGLIAFLLLGNKQKTNKTSDAKDPAASTALFAALEKTAAKPLLRVAMLHKTFATQADVNSNTSPGIVQSSVSEVDTAAGKYGHVWAQKLLSKDDFSMERCVNKQAYTSALPSFTNRPLPKTLPEAQEYIKKLYISNGTFVTCPSLGVVAAGSIELSPARLNDSVVPVTLTAPQAANWKSKVLAAKLFDVKDEGMVAHEGKQLHKYSFTPQGGRTDVNNQLYDIFYETAEIDKVKRDTPQGKWEYSFIPINPNKGGSVKGFYLIDDSTGLPAYSEIQGVNTDRAKDNEASLLNLGFHKTKYTYPSALAIDVNSPLEILE